jgi:hypothetical protein
MGVVTALAVGAAVSVTAGAIADGKAHKAARSARNAKNEAKLKLEATLQDRQDIINPYAGITDLSGLASDLSSQITNPFNNLQVSTSAAEMQAEEADIALANTLDTLEMTGASAGGATALAMAALKSKKGVAASIEEQEAKNAQLRAQGEQAMIQQKVTATTRYQDVAIEEGARAEDAAAQGEIFQFQSQEARTNADLARYQTMYQGFAQQQNAAQIAGTQAWGQVATSVGNMASSAMPYLPKSSDRRLKKNIKLIGNSPSGLKIYAFEYIDKIFGEGIFQGVMSDEIPQEAVIKHPDGYDRVNYSKLDVEFKRI